MGKPVITSSDRFFISVKVPYSRNLKMGNFPEISDFSKRETEFIRKDSLLQITQYYAPTRSGTFQLSPFAVIINGTTYTYNSKFQISVKLDEQIKDFYVGNSEGFKPREFQGELLYELNKKEVFTGEPVTVSLSLLVSADNPAEFNFINLKDQLRLISERMNAENLLTEDNFIFQVVEDSVLKNHEKFVRYILIKKTFYPLTDEDIQFPEQKFSLLSYLTKTEGTTIFRKDTMLNLKAAPSRVKVKAISDAIDFPVIPGEFTLKERLSAKQVNTGDYISYSFTISGEANYAMASPPIINNKPFYLEVIPNNSAESEKNKKTYHYYLISSREGKINLQDVFSWPYFNTITGKTDTLKSSLSFQVKSENTSLSGSYENDSFYQSLSSAGNKIRKLEKDNLLKLFTNLVILFMFAVTAILMIRK